METIIKISPSELDKNLLDKIRAFIGTKENVDVTISIREFNDDYADALDQSINEAENTLSLVSFTMDDFMAYSPSKTQ
ncbi:hypothetical protein [Mucilaginibacter paludis]|uniref:Uncharacterized protein n=1 Tax=Mucilaginibacter paludis DSM 18603 TaxID=714943 RepID=H1XZI5_9SPHI|nr:hypothetical protein [Mucilaginibacter paludis]EHQ26629.1 hypothetical protein Mucpa_2514 [Mucilaginibacter paludis DSM 18603]